MHSSVWRRAKYGLYGFLVSSVFWWIYIQSVYECSPKYQGMDKTITATDADAIGIVLSEADAKQRDAGYIKFAFNELASQRIGFQRSLPDTRDRKCLSKSYGANGKYPIYNASIIICFYNEAWSTLLRTVYSVIDRTPTSYLHEIILFDDFSDMQNLRNDLRSFIESKLPVVKLVRAKRREGLIRARLKAAALATGDVLVFLDSHCEVNTAWLEPLVGAIQANPKAVVCPVIDTISSDTFEYKSSPLVRGGFNWGLHFSWENLPPGVDGETSDPYRSPTMAGGLFAMYRRYFFELGGYDAGMDVWGGENLEISFRVWMCGGHLAIVPCSRVGHVFRNHRPYGDGDKSDAMGRNSVRVAEVWLDEYKQHFYNIRTDLKGMHVDVFDRKALREKLQCKSFKWYLENVYPELGIPMERDGLLQVRPADVKKSVVVYKGKLYNRERSLCLDTLGDPLTKKAGVLLVTCSKTLSKFWSLNEDRELKVDGRLCLDVLIFQSEKEPRSMKCHGEKSGQDWKYMPVLRL